MDANKFNPLAWYERLAPREKNVFHGALACILLLIIDMTAVTPLWDYYIATEERIASSEKTLVRNLVNLQRKEIVEAEYEKFKPFVRPAGRDEEESAALLSEVEQLGRANQVVLVDMKPRDSTSSQFRKEYVAELDAEAEMANLLGFIHQMEESPQLMKVTNVRVVPKEAKSTFMKAKITVVKTVFLGDS